MQAEHLDAVVHIVEASDPHAWSGRLLSDSLATHRCFVLLREAGREVEVVAVAVFQCVCDESELLYVVVNRTLQGQGVGKCFLLETLALLRKGGINSCTLEVRSGNLVAQQVYQQLGFAKVGVRKNYYAAQAGFSVEDALIYRCDFAASPLRVTE